LLALEVEVGSGRIGSEDVTLADLLERWMEHLRSKGRSENTLYGYRRYIERDLLPALGSIRLSKLTALDIVDVPRFDGHQLEGHVPAP